MTSIVLPELNYLLIKHLDLYLDYKNLRQTNKYYHEFIENIKLYKELRELGHIKYLNISRKAYFLKACYYGYLEAVKYLYKNNKKINIHSENEKAFRISCENGQYNVAEWLYSISIKNNIENNKRIDIHAMDDYAFIQSCSNGHKNIAEWLYNISGTENNRKIDINKRFNKAFRYSCCHGHKDIAQWLYNLHDKNIYTNVDSTFRSSYYNGHKDIVQWLYNLSKTDNNIILNNNILFLGEWLKNFK